MVDGVYFAQVSIEVSNSCLEGHILVRSTRRLRRLGFADDGTIEYLLVRHRLKSKAEMRRTRRE